MPPYPDGFNGPAFDARYGTSDEPPPPVIRTPIGWECITDTPADDTQTTVGLVWDDAYAAFFLDVCEKKLGRRADDNLEIMISRDGLRRLVDLATRMLGDRT